MRPIGAAALLLPQQQQHSSPLQFSSDLHTISARVTSLSTCGCRRRYIPPPLPPLPSTCPCSPRYQTAVWPRAKTFDPFFFTISYLHIWPCLSCLVFLFFFPFFSFGLFLCFFPFLVAHARTRTAGPSPCFWRAATDNDRAGWPTLLNFVVDHRVVGLLSKFLPPSRLRYIQPV